jgi:hypothetical protein
VPQNDYLRSQVDAAQEVGALAARTIVLRGGRSAVAVFAPAAVSGNDAAAALGLPPPRRLIALTGGTADLPTDLNHVLRRRLGEGLARVAIDERLTVVTGGTDAGIFTLFGEALGDERTAPCIGVSPADRVTWPGRERLDPNPGDEEPVPLESHHSHFLLIAGGEWGVETDAMLSLIRALSTTCPSVAVLAGGGDIARREVLGHVRAGRNVIVLADSGRFADELADAIAGGPVGQAETAEIAATGLVTVVEGMEPPSTLAELVRERLDGEARWL